MKVTDIPIGRIVEEENRRRERYRDIDKLAAGMNRVGLIEPIVVEQMGNKMYRLVAGARRLRAATELGWETIPCVLREALSDEEMRDIELEENENRDPLTDRERGKTFAASRRLVESAKKAAISLQSETKTSGKQGRPKEPTSTRAVAAALGTSAPSVIRAEQHVDIADEFPFMKGPGWRQSHALAVREYLSEFAPQERAKAGDVLRCARLLDPGDAAKMLENMLSMKPAARQDIYRLTESDDPRDKSLALTKAVQLPPAADPRLNSIEAALDSLRRATKPFPNDPLTPRILAVIVELKAIHVAVKAVSYDARRDAKQQEAVQ